MFEALTGKSELSGVVAQLSVGLVLTNSAQLVSRILGDHIGYASYPVVSWSAKQLQIHYVVRSSQQPCVKKLYS